MGHLIVKYYGLLGDVRLHQQLHLQYDRRLSHGFGLDHYLANYMVDTCIDKRREG